MILEKEWIWTVRCQHCGKLFKVSVEEQTPGFRMKEELYCPHCGKLIYTTMKYEFVVLDEKVEEQ